MMEIFYVCAFQYGSHQLHVVIEHLNWRKWDEKLDFYFYLILIYQSLSSHTCLLATIRTVLSYNSQTYIWDTLDGMSRLGVELDKTVSPKPFQFR